MEIDNCTGIAIMKPFKTFMAFISEFIFRVLSIEIAIYTERNIVTFFKWISYLKKI